MAVGTVNFFGFVGDLASLLKQTVSTAFKFVSKAVLDAPAAYSREGPELRGLHSKHPTMSAANGHISPATDSGRGLVQTMHSSSPKTLSF